MKTGEIRATVQPPHVHLSKKDIKILFGEQAKLEAEKSLDMPGTFAAKQRVVVKSANGAEVVLPIYGPSRAKTQVELNPELSEQLGITAKTELSGKGSTGGVLLTGESGSVELSEGVLIPLPHIHIPPEEASTLSLQDGQSVLLESNGLSAQAIVRVSHMYITRLHLIESETCTVVSEDIFSIT